MEAVGGREGKMPGKPSGGRKLRLSADIRTMRGSASIRRKWRTRREAGLSKATGGGKCETSKFPFSVMKGPGLASSNLTGLERSESEKGGKKKSGAGLHWIRLTGGRD